MTYPQRITGSLWPTFVSVLPVSITVKQVFAITLILPVKTRSKPTLAHLRYFLGGDRPSQTVNHAMSKPKQLDTL